MGCTILGTRTLAFPREYTSVAPLGSRILAIPMEFIWVAPFWAPETLPSVRNLHGLHNFGIQESLFFLCWAPESLAFFIQLYGLHHYGLQNLCLS